MMSMFLIIIAIIYGIALGIVKGFVSNRSTEKNKKR